MSVPTTLPQLSDDDIAELFADDGDAARRYRVVRAVVARGLTQREAAAEAGVSERTVRNVLSAYLRGGSLDALRTRRPGVRPGSSRRAAAAEDALAAALAEDPQLGGDRLWRRAQQLLAERGEQLSRRTAYRILAELRTRSRRSTPPALAAAVRAALPLLVEDPPLTLGAGQLAQRLAPGHAEPQRRGAIVRQALRAAIERLRPAGAVDAGDRSWWPYLICVGEYEDGRPRADVQQELALSASTYSRAKRHALDRIIAAAPQIAAELTASPTAVACQRLPRTPDFVGRREEQAYYAWRLQSEGCAFLWGLPGSGKTALAAELAADSHRAGLRIIWHTCTLGRDSQALLVVRALAQALVSPDEVGAAAVGGDELFETIDLVRPKLAERETLIVLDDAHRLDAADMELLIDVLGAGMRGPATRLLLVGRAAPAAGGWPALPGLSDREARLLWAGAAPLPEEQWRALHETVAGLPQPIIRAAAQQRAGEHGRGREWLAEVGAWAQEVLWSQCTPEERRLIATAHAITACAEQLSLVSACQSLDIAPATLDRLLRAGLLRQDASGVTVLGALAGIAALMVREDLDLRAALDRLGEEAASLDSPADSRILRGGEWATLRPGDGRRPRDEAHESPRPSLSLLPKRAQLSWAGE